MLSSDFITTFLSIFVVSVFSTLADSQRGTEEGLPGEEGYPSHRGQESATTQVPPGRPRICPSWNARREENDDPQGCHDETRWPVSAS
jgi:hypothetical protein